MIECYDLMATIIDIKKQDFRFVLVHLVKCCSLFIRNWYLKLITGNTWTDNRQKCCTPDMFSMYLIPNFEKNYCYGSNVPNLIKYL